MFSMSPNSSSVWGGWWDGPACACAWPPWAELAADLHVQKYEIPLSSHNRNKYWKYIFVSNSLYLTNGYSYPWRSIQIVLILENTVEIVRYRPYTCISNLFIKFSLIRWTMAPNVIVCDVYNHLLQNTGRCLRMYIQFLHSIINHQKHCLGQLLNRFFQFSMIFVGRLYHSSNFYALSGI